MRSVIMGTGRLEATCAAVLALVAVTAAGGEAGRLTVDGGTLAGDFVPVPEVDGGTRDTFLWRSPRFAAPLEFRIGAVAGITFPAPAERPRPSGPFVHLRGGDVIAATVESLDADALVVSAAGPAGPQRLRIDRGQVAAITREADSGGAYAGPAGLVGWEQSPPGSWREEAGRIMTDRARAAVTRDVAAPPRARFEIRLSRRRAAEFRIAVAAAERAGDDGYVLEEVGGQAGGLMLVRRSGDKAAIEPLPRGAWRGDTLRVVLFVDQDRGRLAAVFPDAEGDAAKPIEATLRPVRGGKTKVSGRFRLELTGGDICLERLNVHAWQGDEPTLRDAVKTTVVTRTGPVEGITAASFDPAAGAYVLEREGGTTRVPAAELEEIHFPDAEDGVDDAAVRLVRVDGGAISGGLVKVDDAAVWLRRRGVEGSVAVPRDAIASIQSLRPLARRPEPGGRVGTLLAGEDRVRGWLVGGADGGPAWQPVGGVSAAAFAPPLDAEIEYVPAKPDRKGAVAMVGGIGGIVNRDGAGFFAVTTLTEDGAAARDGRLAPGDRILAIAPAVRANFVETKDLDQETVTSLLRGRVGTVLRLKVVDAAGANPREIDLARGPIAVADQVINVETGEQAGILLKRALEAHRLLAGAVEDAAGPHGDFPSLVILRSGDKVPCRIESIDAETVLLRSPVAGGPAATAVRVPVELVKAVELVLLESTKLDKTLLQRLLTLPRMQRDRPPTHLLRLVNGDYLRGRLVSLDEKMVTFEVLDQAKRFSRDQLARLIWLHPDVPQREGDPPAADAPEPPTILAQGRSQGGTEDDDRCLTVVAETVEGDMLRGRSPAFGECGIDLGSMDRVLLGKAVGRDAGQLPFAKWTLQPAPEPRALRKPDGG